MKKAQFISLEGSEGVGKSTSLLFVKEYLESQGFNVLVTREPGGTPLAEDIRHLLLEKRTEKVESETELLLMFAARYQHVEQVIKPALAEGTWVLCDRFVDASYAYQGGGRGIPYEKLAQLEQWCLNSFEPDLTLLLDMCVKDALERTKARGEADRFEIEKITFFEKIRAAYLNRAKQASERIKVIDAAQSQPQVQLAIKNLLAQFIQG
ncbi:dTMP kinase [Aliikangiella sp. IMCC44632]